MKLIQTVYSASKQQIVRFSTTVITVSLEQSDFNVTEGIDAALSVNVVITEGTLERDVLVTLFTDSGTATSGVHVWK